MNSRRLTEITDRYPRLRVAVLGDFCLDRYLEIDPAREEVSRETGLAVHNVVHVRAQPGAAGTILNNIVALGVGEIIPLGFAGDDGEGFELVRSLRAMPGLRMDSFLTTPRRRTFTYCKPLVVDPGQPPRELNRLDSKNWSPSPPEVEDHLIAALRSHADRIDALIVMDQVDVAETGVVTRRVLDAVGEIVRRLPSLCILADSRRGLRGFPRVCLKMNRVELGAFLGREAPGSVEQTKRAASELARGHGREVIITLAEDGLVGAQSDGRVTHLPALPVRGPIDIVGAGDSVTANLAVALAAGAALDESLALANAAASVVVHQLGTTGTATVRQIAATMEAAATGPVTP